MSVSRCVARAEALVVPNTSHLVEGSPVAGNVVAYAAGGSAPIATIAGGDDENPVSSLSGRPLTLETLDQVGGGTRRMDAR